jgi:RNA polymerase sigma-70 factor (ECF subfamily)
MTAAAQIETTFREEHGRVMAALISQFGDFTLAEDALQDALVEALTRWQKDGVPHNPGAWLTTVARRRAIYRLRRAAKMEHNEVILDNTAADDDTADDEEEVEMETIPDDRLKLMFTCCHPSLALDAQVALTLHTLGGLSTTEIARAFLVPVTTMAQRLTRARAKIRNAGIPYRVPPADLLPARLAALLATIYLIFNEGYVTTGGDALTRSDLCREAIRLCRVLVNLLSESAEARGLLALMLLHDSRRETRLNEAGELVLLDEQDRTKWNQEKIREGVAILDEAMALYQPGPYQVQAAISALHAEAPTAEETDWQQIATLYGTLAKMTPSPVVEVNRAVAVAMAQNPMAGLALLHRIEGVEDFYPYHVARADLLRRTNQREAAADAYERALALCGNNAQRVYLQRRLDEITDLR